MFVNHGLLRKNEVKEVIDTFKNFDLDFKYVDASNDFYKALAGVTEPEEKRKIIGKLFVETFRKEADKLGKIDYLAQGTIYPDVVESGLGGNSAKIKSHHNVGGLPKDIGFKGLVEPLRYLFKDEVRRTGLSLGLPESLVFRQPFPGPGLGIRIIGEVTAEREIYNKIVLCPICGQKLTDISYVNGAVILRVKCRRCKNYINVDIVGTK